MRLIDRLLLALWDPTGEKRRQQLVRAADARRVLIRAGQTARRADRINRLRASYRAAGGRLR